MVRVHDIMTLDVVTVSPETTLRDAGGLPADEPGVPAERPGSVAEYH